MDQEEPNDPGILGEEEQRRMMDPGQRGWMPDSETEMVAVGVAAATVAAAAAIVGAVTAAATAIITGLSKISYRSAAIETVNLTDKEMEFRLPSHFWAGHLAEYPEPMSIPPDRKGTFGVQKTKASPWGVGGISATTFDSEKDVLLFYVNPTAGRAVHGCWFVKAGTPLDASTFNACWYKTYGRKVEPGDVKLDKAHRTYMTWSNIGQAGAAHMEAIVYDTARDYQKFIEDHEE